MQEISTLEELLRWRKSQTQSIGFVPTMGALHEGHLSLLTQSRLSCDITVASIFVNPLQFSLGEDFDAYPRSTQADREICEANGCDVLFLPSASEMYPQGLERLTKVIGRAEMSNCLCGLSRPGHFEGVLTVVLKLFNLLMPHKAFFGEKDFQQLRLIESLVEDFNLNIQVVRCPTVRLPSGLAMSSRNKYLTESEKQEASHLYATLKTAENAILKGSPVNQVINELRQSHFEYFEARDPDTMMLTDKLPARLFIAAKVGKARLIDNLEITAHPEHCK